MIDMLQFVLGRSGCGKTEYVFNEIKKLIESGENRILLITPEQFSFAAERRLLSDLGEINVSKVENASFSRLASEASKIYGGDKLPVLSKGAKAVMMKRAVESVQDGLELFSRHASSPSFIESAVRIYDEMKACRVNNEDLIEARKSAPGETLRQKLGDISKIITAYDALIDGKYYDSADTLTRLYNKLINRNYFENRVVLIDGFYGFAAQEYKIIEIILKQAKFVYVTFCTDSFYNRDKFDLFSYINRNVAILKEVAKKIGVKTLNPIILAENKRSSDSVLRSIEENAFSATESDCDPSRTVNIYSAKNITDECDRTAFQISRLLRQGVRAGNIAIVTRDLDKYKKELEFSFDKYNIPYYNDERQIITSQPIIMFVNFLLRTAVYGLRSNDIFSLLKTGLTSLGSEEIGALENYVYIWGIDGSAWKNEFIHSTKGFTENISESDRKAIDEINRSRIYVIDRILKFISSVKNKTAKEICSAVYFALIDFSCDKRLKDLAVELDKKGKSALAKQQGRVWDLLMETLDTLALLGENEKIGVDEFYKIFNLMITNEDLGTLPSGLDNVQLGSADRMRFDNPEIVFIVGANEGEFPQNVTSSGLLSETDRIALIESDFKLYSYGETLNAQERFFAYMALSAPKEKLFVSFCGAQGQMESSIVSTLKTIFPKIKVECCNVKLGIDSVESADNAFELLASNYNNNDEFIASLKSYFAGHSEYASRLAAVESLINNANPVIEDKNVSTELFGRDMYLSASRIEDYYNCAFRYFCKFGIGARPLIKAEMNPMQTGTVIHYVLENAIMNYSKEEFTALSPAEIKIIVNKYLSDFIKTKMGDTADLSNRFKYQFMRLSKMLVYVVERLRDELSQCDFIPQAFELAIGDGSNNEEVKSCKIPIGDGGFITIKGAVDRVDTLLKGDKRYVRVIDYKSGNKEFSLSDIMYGLNLQMFIYLFMISKTDNPYNGISAGVLYMHTSRSIVSVSTNNSAEAEEKSGKAFKMKGLVLNDESHSVAENMEYELKGKYIPVKSGRQGVSGNIATLEELGHISRKIDSLISQMGLALHNGYISQNPITGVKHDKTCEYCDYSNVCMNRSEVEFREFREFSREEVLEKLKEEYGGNVD